MTTESKLYITAPEVATPLGVSVGHAYKMIREINRELAMAGYMVIAGKAPKGYFETRWYSFGA